MLKSPLLFAIGVLVSLLSWTASASANDGSIALSFSLPPTPGSLVTEKPGIDVSKIETPITEVSKTDTSTTIEQVAEETAEQIAESTTIELQINNSAPAQPGSAESNIYTKDEQQSPSDIGVHFAATNLTLPTAAKPEQSDVQQVSRQPSLSTDSAKDGADTVSQSQSLQGLEAVAFDSLGLDDWIFEGGSSSLVAHTVGSAEGTRLWNGQRTKAYYGHEDPGNGVWNLGTFSYQHAASGPEDADEKQLRRLKTQGLELERQASNVGIRLSLEEKLNGLDLANQAPIAALGRGGYIERLDQAYRMKMEGFEAISWARTRSYIDPDTKTWNAPGLGNNLLSINRDQERRMAEINKALRAYDRDSNTKIALARLETIGLDERASEGTAIDGPIVGETDELLAWAANFDGDSDASYGDEITENEITQNLSTQNESLENEGLEASVNEPASAVATESAPIQLLPVSNSPVSFVLPSTSTSTAALTNSEPTQEGNLAESSTASTAVAAGHASDTAQTPVLDGLQASVLQPIEEGTSLESLSAESLSAESLSATAETEATPSTPEDTVATPETSSQDEEISDESLITTAPSSALELIETTTPDVEVQNAGSEQAALLTEPGTEAIELLKSFADPAGSLQPLAAAPEEGKSKWRIRTEDKVLDNK